MASRWTFPAIRFLSEMKSVFGKSFIQAACHQKLEGSQYHPSPPWVEVNADSLQGTVSRFPQSDELEKSINAIGCRVLQPIIFSYLSSSNKKTLWPQDSKVQLLIASSKRKQQTKGMPFIADPLVRLWAHHRKCIPGAPQLHRGCCDIFLKIDGVQHEFQCRRYCRRRN